MKEEEVGMVGFRNVKMYGYLSKHNNNSMDKHTDYTSLAIKSSTFQDIHGIQSLKEHT